ncbi:MAG: cysteine--tRNA ligase [Leptospiraceae bacterium]|nr:cysteine--tRNA ligase [Leptospiraceae bacterium]MCP5497484.1 cysteine--tRNA ligase [Leptospiraceae bacterium]
MKLQFYNTLTSVKEAFEPEDKNKVKIYSCGPTVYNYPHIGNLRSFMFVDTLRRTLKLLGYGLNQTMNITDIDDKIIRDSITENTTVEKFTQKWIDIFFEDLQTLKIEKVENYPRATETIPDMLRMIETLENNQLTYQKDGNIYFSIGKFHEYGSLSKLDVTGIKSGARYDADEYEKDDVRDFALWKSPKQEDEKAWESKFGKGRPGWHLECSAMIRKIYQSGIDIHTGGIDLIFPHHENEIAQSRGAYPQDHFVKYWLHCEHLLVEGQKMSKSLGNFYTLRDVIAQGYDPLSIRYLLLSFHYRTKLNFSFSRLEESKKAIAKLQNTLDRVLELTNFQVEKGLPKGYAREGYNKFLEGLCDDLNVPKSLGEIFEFIKKVNNSLDSKSLSEGELLDITSYFHNVNSLLQVLSFEKSLLDSEIEALIDKRNQARKDKNFKLSDEIRDDLLKKGIKLEDSKTGVKWKRI